MVKYLSTRHLAVIASLLVMMTATAAEDFWFNDLHYVVTGNNTVALASHPDNPYAYSGEVIIPESVTGDNGATYTVTAIADSAFAGCTNVTRVVVPNSVTTIGERAFHHCLFLADVELPETVSTIGKAAFMSCLRLQDFTFPAAMTAIQDSTFNGCSKLTSLYIPNPITSIGTAAFASCWRLETVNMANSVEILGDLAFANCSALTSVTISDNLLSLDRHHDSRLGNRYRQRGICRL